MAKMPDIEITDIQPELERLGDANRFTGYVYGLTDLMNALAAEADKAFTVIDRRTIARVTTRLLNEARSAGDRGDGSYGLPSRGD